MGEIVGIDKKHKCVLLKNDEIHYDKLIVASPAAQWLGIETDRSGRVAVDDNLQVESCEDVYRDRGHCFVPE